MIERVKTVSDEEWEAISFEHWENIYEETAGMTPHERFDYLYGVHPVAPPDDD